jgi:hypothetical protein
MPRYGRVNFVISYVVDLDDAEMVADAKQCVFEDVHAAVKHDDVPANITVTEDLTATQTDIPDFLLRLSDEDPE